MGRRYGRKDQRVIFRLTSDERRTLEGAASARRQSLSAFVREVSLRVAKVLLRKKQ